MATHTTQLEAREEIAERTMAFHLRKPAHFEFKAGQAIDLILPLAQNSAGGAGPADDADARHAFSLVAAPYQEELMVATRLRDSAYKRTLGALAVGTPLSFDGPFGSLTLHNKLQRAAVFLAGGIGITPFMSMLRQAAHEQRAQPLVLLYSNRRPEDAAFLAELQGLEKKNPHFRLVATMTEMQASRQPWAGDTGQITSELITRSVRGLNEPIFYLAGPPGMVGAMRHTLNGAGIDDDDIRSEEFYGY